MYLLFERVPQAFLGIALDAIQIVLVLVSGLVCPLAAGLEHLSRAGVQ
jgi:hypothetical protein